MIGSAWLKSPTSSSSSSSSQLAPAAAAASSSLTRNFVSAPIPDGEKRLFKYQDSLPRLPVPTLEETLPRFLETCKPLLTKEEYAHTHKLVQEFPDKAGRKLQQLLLQKAQASKTHWLEDWWNNLGYLEYRDPVCVWVNYGFTLKDEKYDLAGANPQTNRAARLIHSALQFKHLVET